jgi:hypothetical protein
LNVRFRAKNASALTSFIRRTAPSPSRSQGAFFVALACNEELADVHFDNLKQTSWLKLRPEVFDAVVPRVDLSLPFCSTSGGIVRANAPVGRDSVIG